MDFDFDKRIERRGTNSQKWDEMENRYGISADDGIAMWVADHDFAVPPAVNETLKNIAEHGVHGYFGNDRPYLAAIQHWMASRHGWVVAPEWILSFHGLVHGITTAIQAFSEPGEGVILFSPVYHAFYRVIRYNGREVLESPLVERDGRYHMDLDALGKSLTGNEKMVIISSPHNPGGRVWSLQELRALAEFCERHDLLLVSDEIHQDLVYPGQMHTVSAMAAPDHLDRLIVLNAPSKVFNMAGSYNGQAIIPDPGLRRRMVRLRNANGFGLNRISALMTTAAYAHGAPWVDELVTYLDENRRIFEERMNAIPGVKAMRLQATYLEWVDFSGTGMSPEEFTRRVEREARVAANHGHTFGTGGETFLRFNIGLPRATMRDALERIETAFSDLQ